MNLNLPVYRLSSSIQLALAITTTILLLGGCSKAAHRILQQPAPMLTSISPDERPNNKSQNADSTLAYTHNLSIEVSREHLQAQLNAVRDACNAAADHACTILSISIEPASLMPSGNISVRLTPQGVDALVALAAHDAKIISNSTAAEDLAPELNDTAEKLQALTSYRDRLNGIMSKGNLNPDQLIAIARELSNTQTQIEQLTRDRSKLKQRVDTQLLTINFQVPTDDYSNQQTPVKDALNYFGQHFRDALAGIITFFAYVLPWIPVLLLSFFGIRKLWQLLKKKSPTQPAT